MRRLAYTSLFAVSSIFLATHASAEGVVLCKGPITPATIAVCGTVGVTANELRKDKPFGKNGEVASAARKGRDWVGDRTGARKAIKWVRARTGIKW